MDDALSHEIYVISDLHLGGSPPDLDKPGDLGFRIFNHSDVLIEFIRLLTSSRVDGLRVELVINGDFVDFLAEPEGDGSWAAVRSDPEGAVKAFETIVGREQGVFRALAEFLAKGHRLTLLLGNHDIELSFPAVRRALEEALGIDGRQDFRFLYDGEAYVVGDVLIEHGNRYDRYNENDYDALRRIRSLQSRRQPVPEEYHLKASPGSELVATTINPIKEDYPLINLLKPENDACFPLLLALDPSLRGSLLAVVRAMNEAGKHGMRGPLLPRRGGAVASSPGPGSPTRSRVGGMAGRSAAEVAAARKDELDEAIEQRLGPDGYRLFLQAIREPGHGAAAGGGPVAGGVGASLTWAAGLLRLVTERKASDLERRIPALVQSLRNLQDDETFVRTKEPPGEYLNAVNDLAKLGFKAVLFGHTHLARDIVLKPVREHGAPGDRNGDTFSPGCRYLNTGTWADIIRFPSEILKGSDEEVSGRVFAFAREMISREYAKYTVFTPTYAKLALGRDGSLLEAGLHVFTQPPMAMQGGSDGA